MTFSLEEVDRATASFHDSRKIGEGGYGSVYLGILGTQVIEISSSVFIPEAEEHLKVEFCVHRKLPSKR